VHRQPQKRIGDDPDNGVRRAHLLCKLRRLVVAGLLRLFAALRQLLKVGVDEDAGARHRRPDMHVLAQPVDELALGAAHEGLRRAEVVVRVRGIASQATEVQRLVAGFHIAHVARARRGALQAKTLREDPVCLAQREAELARRR
jgi:hypothetical protein